MRMPRQLAAPCAHRDRVSARRVAMPDRIAAAEAAPNAAGAADVADSKRNFVYGLHAVSAALERAPERVLEMWLASPRDDGRARELKARAEVVGLHIHTASPDA